MARVVEHVAACALTCAGHVSCFPLSTAAIAAIDQNISWWKKLNDVEQCSTVNIDQLVRVGESVINAEWIAWNSTTIRTGVDTLDKNVEAASDKQPTATGGAGPKGLRNPSKNNRGTEI